MLDATWRNIVDYNVLCLSVSLFLFHIYIAIFLFYCYILYFYFGGFKFCCFCKQLPTCYKSCSRLTMRWFLTLLLFQMPNESLFFLGSLSCIWDDTKTK